MHWITLILFSAAVSSVISEPDPKKFKPEEKDKKLNSTLSDEERKFLREVEEKFGIKPDIPEPSKEDISEQSAEKLKFKPGFPAVIAIEIVNDTESNGKGKRTIDANLGYGYRTHNGYMYSYFGKPTQEKGKFMIYPYSQHDIPPARKSHFKSSSNGYYSGAHHGSKASVVEIQPSQAYELVPVKDESSYDSEKGLDTPPPPYPSSISTGPGSTLYTTYNGQQLSSLQGHFPMVMSNYFVEPSQLLQNPHYQSVGLTKDHIQSHDSNTEQRIVPVLVLRVPSSYLKNPSAELYANLPNNYPLSNYLNNVNLQDLVNQYFKKIGFSYAPQIMAYKNEGQEEIPQPAEPETHYNPQQYANPYVSPAYTSDAQYSGVQYSAVQPVMAKYPAKAYANSQYYVEQPQSQYEPAPQHQYEYQYQYVMPQADPQVSSYYMENNYPQTQQYQTSYETPSEAQEQHVHVTTNSHVGTIISHQNEQQIVQEALNNVEAAPAVAIGNHHSQYSGDSSSQQSYQESVAPTAGLPAAYGSPAHTEYYDSPSNNQHYESSAQSHHAPKETVAILSSYARPSPSKHNSHYVSTATNAYQTSQDNEAKTIVISENYPSSDHTHAYVTPHRYKSSKHGGAKIQTVNYVTPTPNSASKYQSRYRVMVPQTVLQPDEKVTYVNSHSLPAHYLREESNSDYNLGEGNTASYQYAPAAGPQKTPLYPRNHHSHPKRMAKNPNHKKESTTKSVKVHSTPKPEKVLSNSKKST